MNPSTHQAPLLVILAGPAGSGKSTLCERLASTEPGFARVVTATTRPPRNGEVDGVDYHFLAPETFDARLAAGEFLEWAWVHGKHRYGTLASAVLEPLRRGLSLAMNIDVQGVDKMRQAAAAEPLLRRCMVTVFIAITPDEMRRRLTGRGTDSMEEIERRMRTAEGEIREQSKFDHIIVSRTRDEDYRALIAICEAARRKAV